MTLIASQVRIPGTGEVFIREPGGTAPVTPTDPLTGSVGLGYTQEDGVTIARAVNREGVPAWQSVSPVKYIYNGLTLSLAAAFLQSQNEVASMWWGGDFAETGNDTGVFKSDLSTIPTAIEKTVGLKWKDDEGFNHLIYVPRIEVGATGDVAISRKATAFQITFDALTPETGEVMATWLTDDPNFAPE